ncbi:hypothetical protein [Georgenia sp. H159]|uniref:hypothetical protein n=1 Tax=Georgenia sp. H159 TaxID=3076115 RepID=UPI002D7A0E5C|nr:hypothetical protein [Georgenia sp. H159]
MATTTAPPRAPTVERLLSSLVAVAAMVGIVVAAVPSVLLLVDPPDPWFCPAVFPPATSCVPDAHLVVVAVAVVVLVSAWVSADVALRRVNFPLARAGVVAGLAVIALIAWSASRVPQPYFSAWAALFS